MEFCFENDEDGHWYIIPVGAKEEFQDWIEYMYSYPTKPWRGTDFDSMICSMHVSNYGFTNPRELR